MRPFSLLFMLFLAVSFAEIYVLIEVGRRIGSLGTIFLLVFTAVLGALLVRMQGMQTYIQIQRSVSQGRMPAQEMIEGVMIMIAGLLLLTPGFVTDTVGFVFLVPAVRRTLIALVISRQTRAPQKPESGPVFEDGPKARSEGGGRVIEGELDDD
jgi:UPF0716 protein FxsA